MGLFFSSKKPVASTTSGSQNAHSTAGRFDHGSKGRITQKEFEHIGRRFKDVMSHGDAERLLEGLRPNMDRDGFSGGHSMSKKEVQETLDYMAKNHHTGLSSSDIEKARTIIDEYE